AERGQAEKAVEAAAGARDTQRDHYTEAEALSRLYQQLDRAESELENCRRAEEAAKGHKDQITLIRAAYEIQTVWNRCEDAARDVERTERDLNEQEAAVPGLRDASAQAAKAEAQAKETSEEELAEHSRISERVARSLEVFGRIREAEAEVKRSREAAKTAGEKAGNAKQQLLDLEAQEQIWRGQAAELEDADRKLVSCEGQIRDSETLASDLADGRLYEASVQERESIAIREARKYNKAKERHQRAREEYDTAHTMFLDAQAGYLARSLEEGKPCPVCGSLTHPRPCPVQESHAELTKEKIDQLAQTLSDAETSLREQAQESGTANRSWEERKQSFAELLAKLQSRAAEQLGVIPGEDPSEWSIDWMADLIEGKIQHLRGEEKALKEDVKTLQEVRASLAGVDEDKARLRQASDAAAEEASRASAALLERETVLTGLQEQKDYPTETEAQAAQQAADLAKSWAEEAFRNAKSAADDAAKALSASESLIRQFRETLPHLRETAQERQMFYAKALAATAFTGTEWQELTARYTTADADRMQEEAEQLQQQRAAAQGSLDAARESISGRERPDLDTLLTAREEAQQKYEEAVTVLNRVREDCKVNRDVYDALLPKMEERSRITAEYDRAQSLYRRLAGKNTGERMDLETFVQRYYLERILHAANRRFREMSGGQFELRMVSREQAGSGGNKGLDLRVYSTVTGREREIRTLSGGESFLAALSLALGMADQIQANSSSIHLDMMFIDEGFGSLDDHARDQAVRVLRQMAGGERLIGIISHVTELKQEIDDQLIVTRDEDGSHVRWQVS
ncbi:MAG: hypothetical protein IJH77_03745, partial [Mogibacterium sp.]|nr:hypothetical protein [Mogibacterium sp.]